MWILVALVVTALAAKPTTVEEFLAQPVEKHVEQLTGQAFVNYINEHQSFYRAEYSPKTEARMKHWIMDSKFLVKDKEAEVLSHVVHDVTPPESFDARDQWPECKSISLIHDQSACSSCWAVSSASAMTDELCVQSNGTIKLILSDTDLLACCDDCGGCAGGWPSKAYKWAEKRGVVTGGLYRQKNVCKPYVFYPCGEHEHEPYYGPCPETDWNRPTCRWTCNYQYKKKYQEDKHFVKRSYYLPENETSIRQEIFVNGPVVAIFTVYDDFLHYKEGVYVHKWGSDRGSHAVKVIGWGEEKGLKYWLIANSLNTDWGDKGYFRFLRGTNHCNIETLVYGGIMKI
ncbi:hypothetical protein Y032_0154g2996 [Ancylostoma ceylanicum]|nr:hypothetical protein Y032_0154g2996 [Ancylostoma ceylanicum]